jgi:DNA-binding CsgD family transcriptional regulator
MDGFENLRPLERRITRLAAAGMPPQEIGRRFHRSGSHVERVLTLAGLPDRHARPRADGLTPIERRLLRWRDAGATPEEVADRFRRGPGYVERVLALADYKQNHA